MVNGILTGIGIRVRRFVMSQRRRRSREARSRFARPAHWLQSIKRDSICAATPVQGLPDFHDLENAQ